MSATHRAGARVLLREFLPRIYHIGLCCRSPTGRSPGTSTPMPSDQVNVISFPGAARQGRGDDGARAVIRTLETQLALARNGRLRSIALASISSDGSAIQTGCSCDHDNATSLAGTLAHLARA